MISFEYKIDDKQIMFDVVGHAGATFLGFDPVCGMISVLSQSAAVGCCKYGQNFKMVTCENGRVCFTCRNTKVARAIVESIAEGIKQVRLQFPQCFCEVKENAK